MRLKLVKFFKNLIIKKHLTLKKALILAPLFLAGCAGNTNIFDTIAGKDSQNLSLKTYSNVKYTKKQLVERECLMRAMYFESNRSSFDGMIAVGTVVMNRVNSSAFPNTICGVVGQKNQFAPGVLTRKMTEENSVKLAAQAADAILQGKRSKKSKNAMFFHTAGLSFPYKNMHYVEVAGGNAFYEKRSRNGRLQVPVNDAPYTMTLAYVSPQTAQNFDAQIPEDRLENRQTTLLDNIITSSIKVAENTQKNAIVDDEATTFTLKEDNTANIPIPTPSPIYVIKTKDNNNNNNVYFDTALTNYTLPSQNKLNEIGELLKKHISE